MTSEPKGIQLVCLTARQGDIFCWGRCVLQKSVQVWVLMWNFLWDSGGFILLVSSLKFFFFLPMDFFSPPPKIYLFLVGGREKDCLSAGLLPKWPQEPELGCARLKLGTRTPLACFLTELAAVCWDGQVRQQFHLLYFAVNCKRKECPRAMN